MINIEVKYMGIFLLQIELEQLGEYKPMIGYLLNAFTVTTLLLVLANVLNISLFPSVSEVVQSTGRSWKAGRSLEGLASAVDAALDLFSNIDKQDKDGPGHDQHAWNIEGESE